MNPLTLLIGNWQRLALYAALATALLSAAWFKGYQAGRDKLDDYIGQQAAAATAIAVKRGKVTERVVTEYVTQVVPHTEHVTETVEKEVIRYVEKNPGYCLDGDWRRLHDAAALNAVPRGPGDPDEAGGPPPRAAEALGTVTGNYAACNRTADRLDALQRWVREQAAVTAEPR